MKANSIEDKCILIETELNKSGYKNIEVGGLLAHYLSKIVLNNNTGNSTQVLNYIFLIIKYYFKSLISVFYISKERQDTKNKVLVLRTGNNPHAEKLINPIIEYYKNNCLIVGASLTNSSITYSSAIKFSFTDFIYYTIKFLSIGLSFILLCIKQNISYSRIVEGILELQIQLIRLNYWEKFFSENKLQSVITIYDRYNHSSPIILAANKYHIPTVTLVHGALSSAYGFTPVLAKTILVWGEKQKDTLLKKGVLENKIIVTGCPLIEIADRKQVSNPYQKYKQVICLAINPIQQVLNEQLIDLYISQIACFPEFMFLIKLHPSQQKSTFSKYSGMYENLLLVDKNDFSNEEIFGFCNLIVVHNSGFGIEALLNNIPVVILNNIPFKLMINEELLKETNCKSVKTPSEYKGILENIATDYDSFRIMQLNAAQKFISQMYHSVGEKAVNDTISAIEKINK